MKIIFAIVACTCMFITPQPAHATYTNLQVERQRVMLQDGTLMNQFRVYATFNDPLDTITAVSGSPTLGNMVLQSRNNDDSAVGSTFYNAPGGGGTAPTLAGIANNPDVAHDTFVTIGISIAEQGTQVP